MGSEFVFEDVEVGNIVSTDRGHCRYRARVARDNIELPIFWCCHDQYDVVDIFGRRKTRDRLFMLFDKGMLEDGEGR